MAPRWCGAIFTIQEWAQSLGTRLINAHESIDSGGSGKRRGGGRNRAAAQADFYLSRRHGECKNFPDIFRLAHAFGSGTLPATQINSLTGRAGGSRAATAPKADLSLSDIGSAAAAFRTARHMSQLGP
jgi:hypothetical protein